MTGGMKSIPFREMETLSGLQRIEETAKLLYEKRSIKGYPHFQCINDLEPKNQNED